MPEKDVEQLLVSLILDNRIDGHIDQVNRLLERGDRYHIIFLVHLAMLQDVLSFKLFSCLLESETPGCLFPKPKPGQRE